MRKGKLTSQSGVTLMEVTIAIAIFAVVIAVSAQSLASFYATMDMQEERIEAVQRARGVLNAIREKRAQYQLRDNTFDWDGMMAWYNAQASDGWSDYLSNPEDGGSLQNHAINVTLLNLDGSAPAIGDTPLELHVTSTWTGHSGREMRVSVVGILAER